MTYEQHRTTIERDVVTPSTPTGDRSVQAGQVVEQRDTTVYRPSGSTLAARIIIVVFGVLQALLLARIVLLVLDAQRSNDLVAAILTASQPFVAPFEGMFSNDALTSGGSVLDIAAITALVALTLLELVILAIVRIPRRSETV
jgi:uncharacterized protein YggT (Ycf19 family)